MPEINQFNSINFIFYYYIILSIELNSSNYASHCARLTSSASSASSCLLFTGSVARMSSSALCSPLRSALMANNGSFRTFKPSRQNKHVITFL